MEIIFIRHGEAQHNRDREQNIDISKYWDSPLTSLGKNQCYNCPKIKDADIIFTSPLTRALNTTDIICGDLKKDIYVLREIAEFESICKDGKINRFTGSFREQSYVKKRFPNFNWSLVKELSIFRNSKSGTDNDKIRKLLCQFLKSFLDTLKYKKIIIISHGAFINKFMEYFGSNYDYNQRLKNCEHVFTIYDGKSFKCTDRKIYKLKKLKDIPEEPLSTISKKLYSKSVDICKYHS